MKKIASSHLIHAGISTFMRVPYTTDINELSEFDIAVVGIPLDYGASYRDGAKLAPRIIREYSHWDEVDGGNFFDMQYKDMLESNNLNITDIGDILVSPTDPEATHSRIVHVIENVRKRGVAPLILGGDHSITYSCFIGCSNGLSNEKKPIGILHFDAHLDLEDTFSVMPRVWHGNPFRLLIQEGYLKPENLISIGIRGIVPEAWVAYSKDKGTKIYSISDIKSNGLEKIMNKAINELRSNCKSVYVTFDIDCIDPSQAPGTGTPSFGGLLVQDVVKAIHQLRQLPLIGFDCVEVNPKYDPSGLTIVAVCDILWNFLAFGYKRT